MTKKQFTSHILRAALCAATMVCAVSTGVLAADTGVITGDIVNARTGPGTGYSRIETLSKGKAVTILSEENGWYKVSWNQSTGYICKDYVAASSGSAANATVTGGSINVRIGPGTSYSRVGMLGTGKRVTLLAEEGGWFRISFDGGTGYILGDYLVPDSGALDALVAAEAAQQPEAVTAALPVASVKAASVEASAPELASSGEPSRRGFIIGGTINVRAGAGTEFERVTQAGTGKRVVILGEENGWFQVSFDDVTGYVFGDYVYEGDSLPVSSVGEQVAAMARQYLGTRYVYGGSSPSGFDCSGFALYLYKQFGCSLPHTASGQYANCGSKVSRGDLLPGDLVFFTSPGAGGRINHVAIYVGGGEIIHARYSIGKVHSNSLSETYYNNNYVGAVRIA